MREAGYERNLTAVNPTLISTPADMGLAAPSFPSLFWNLLLDSLNSSLERVFPLWVNCGVLLILSLGRVSFFSERAAAFLLFFFWPRLFFRLDGSGVFALTRFPSYFRFPSPFFLSFGKPQKVLKKWIYTPQK